MALIKCPECERDVSDRAAACPGCGCPIKEEKKEVKPDYMLSVPQGYFKSKVGNYLRVITYIIWGLGLAYSIVISIETKIDRWGDSETYWNFISFLIWAVMWFVVGVIVNCFAQFFDDVHTINKRLEGMELARGDQASAASSGASVTSMKASSVSNSRVSLTDVAMSNPSDSWVCKKCGESNIRSAQYCRSCGAYK